MIWVTLFVHLHMIIIITISELEECQSEIRKLEARSHEAEQKRRKVEEKHYSSIRYKQMYESEMRLNKHSMPALVSYHMYINQCNS